MHASTFSGARKACDSRESDAGPQAKRTAVKTTAPYRGLAWIIVVGYAGGFFSLAVCVPP